MLEIRSLFLPRDLIRNSKIMRLQEVPIPLSFILRHIKVFLKETWEINVELVRFRPKQQLTICKHVHICVCTDLLDSLDL
jgi:hypothetical protein